MHASLISNWNAKVKPKDTIFVLGDFSFGNLDKTKDVLSQLNGHKILVWGNHDRPAHRMLAVGFNEVYGAHRIQIGNTYVSLSHFPFYPSFWAKIKTWLKFQKLDTRYLDHRIVNRGQWLLHGHVHNAWKVKERQINVGVDVWGYSPVSLEALKSIIERGERV